MIAGTELSTFQQAGLAAIQDTLINVEGGTFQMGGTMI